MSDELLMVGQACNLGCTYCYENPMREAHNAGGTYDLNSIFKALDKRDQYFSLFGGEPLLVPIRDLTAVLEYGYRKYGKTGIQTNGTLVTNEHIDLFKKFKTHVGLSIDGPGELNSPRVANNGRTKESTELSLKAIDNLVSNGISVGLIITLHKANCSNERFTDFLTWIKCLDLLPVYDARLHILESHHDPNLALSEDELVEVLIQLHQYETNCLKNLKFDKFREMLTLLENPDANATCIWKECDVYNTAAVQGISGHGTMHNCGRTNKDGVDWTKSESISSVRQISLYNTPQEHGGCKDCRFFLACRGFCPGTAIETDWRNRTESCGTIKRLYTYFEKVLRAAYRLPFTDRGDRLQREARYLTSIASGTIRSENRNHEDWSVVDGKLVMKLEVTR